MRPEKASIVSDLSEKLKHSPFVLVTDYQRMKVGDFGELRNRLVPTGAEVHVVKNNFLKRALTDSGFPDVGDKLVGQTAVVTGEKDVAPVARIFKTFATEFKVAALKIGCVNRADLSAAHGDMRAELPAREVWQGQLLKKNGRNEQISGTTQRAIRARDSWFGQAIGREMGRERGCTGGRSRGSGRWRGSWWRSSGAG